MQRANASPGKQRKLGEAGLALQQLAGTGGNKGDRTNIEARTIISRETQVPKHNERIFGALVDGPSPLMLADLEPFVEFPRPQCLGRASGTFRFGYRCKQTGIPFAIVEIPASTVAQFVPLRASVRVTIDGKVVAEAELPNDPGAPAHISEGVSLVQLIEATLHEDNLRMEEASPHELSSLLQELETAMQRVKAALATMHVQGGTTWTSGSV